MDRISSANPSKVKSWPRMLHRQTTKEVLGLEMERVSPCRRAHRAMWQLCWDPTPHTTLNNPSATTCSMEPLACQAWEAPLLARLGPAQLGSLWGESVGQGARLGDLLFL